MLVYLGCPCVGGTSDHVSIPMTLGNGEGVYENMRIEEIGGLRERKENQMETGMKMKKSRPVVCFRRRRRRTNSAGTLACRFRCTFPCHLQRAEGLSQGERKAASRALIGVTLPTTVPRM